jgi:hypothetical protein
LPAKKNDVGVYEITESDLDKWEKSRGRSKDWYRVPEPEKKPEKKAAMALKEKRGKSFRNKK